MRAAESFMSGSILAMSTSRGTELPGLGMLAVDDGATIENFPRPRLRLPCTAVFSQRVCLQVGSAQSAGPHDASITYRAVG